MKKLSGLLVVVMMFVMVATAMGRVENVQAMTFEEIDHSESLWFTSSKAGSSVYFRYSMVYETAKDEDITGWKAALCPTDNITLDAAVVTYALSNSNKYINDERQWAYVSGSFVFAEDIPEGEYVKAFFDASGSLVSADSYNPETAGILLL